MQSLQISEIIALIEAKKTFKAEAHDKSFRIKVNRYVPYCCTAVHDGSRLRSALKEHIALDDYDRWYEEDPHTGDFIASLPITIVGQDSRYEYDLNRSPESCIYDVAWGKKVWKKKISPQERQKSLLKHEGYYQVIHALIAKLEELFNGCVVYDFHSYNYQRWDRKVPLFNIGIEKVDQLRYKGMIDNWQKELSAISLAGVKNETNINDVFFGRGYNLEYITSNFKNTLVLATEVKKVYCNEVTGEEYPKVIKELQQTFKKAVINNANYFSQELTNWKFKNSVNLLDNKIDTSVYEIDKELYRVLKSFELLAYVNPNNTITERKRFLKNNGTELPKFKYSPIQIHPFELKQQLSQLPTKKIADVSIRHLYESVISSYFDKTDMLASLNSRKFFYNSLRYFGRPSKKDMTNANYLLHLPPVPSEPKTDPNLSAEEAIVGFKHALEEYDINCKIELSNKVISQVMVLNSKKLILFRPDAKFTSAEIKALIEHEIGVHMVTTLNSNIQQLKIFNLGLPVNTLTQEGMAILAEYLSGNITLRRLKKLALRVVVTDMMCNGATFIECHKFLTDGHGVSANEAFTITTRIFRGGGFTKDYLYLSGFVKVLKFYNDNNSLAPLLVGKTSLNFYDTISEMIDRNMVTAPQHITRSFEKPNLNYGSEIYSYIISGLI